MGYTEIDYSHNCKDNSDDCCICLGCGDCATDIGCEFTNELCEYCNPEKEEAKELIAAIAGEGSDDGNK